MILVAHRPLHWDFDDVEEPNFFAAATAGEFVTNAAVLGAGISKANPRTDLEAIAIANEFFSGNATVTAADGVGQNDNRLGG